MDCKQVERRLDDYLAGNLTPPARAEIEAHIAHCSTCQALFLPEDEELDLMLSGEWFQMEPADRWVERMIDGTQPAVPWWAGIGVAAYAWSAYVGLWSLVVFRFFGPSLLTDLLGWFRRSELLLVEVANVFSTLWRSLGLVAVSPIAVVTLLLLVILTVLGIRRLEKEGLA